MRASREIIDYYLKAFVQDLNREYNLAKLQARPDILHDINIVLTDLAIIRTKYQLEPIICMLP